jgi:hypothetical protein
MLATSAAALHTSKRARTRLGIFPLLHVSLISTPASQVAAVLEYRAKSAIRKQH